MRAETGHSGRLRLVPTPSARGIGGAAPALRSRIQGHNNYFGVNGNLRSLACLLYHAHRAWHKWLCRRSQRARLTWERFQELLRDYPLPSPRVVVPIWGLKGRDS